MHEQLVSRRAQQAHAMAIQNVLATMKRHDITVEELIDYVAAEACTRAQFIVHTTRGVAREERVEANVREEAAPKTEAPAQKRVGVRQL